MPTFSVLNRETSMGYEVEADSYEAAVTKVYRHEMGVNRGFAQRSTGISPLSGVFHIWTRFDASTITRTGPDAGYHASRLDV